MSDLDSQHIITYDKNIQEVIVRKKRKRIMGKFSAVSQLSKVGEGSHDIFDLLCQVSKGAFGVFNELKHRRDEQTNLTTFITTDLSKTKRETFSRNLKELRQVDVVRIAKRTMTGTDPGRPYVSPRQTYMLNPILLKCWGFEDAELLWGQCKK